jgi:hypothetical protein
MTGQITGTLTLCNPNTFCTSEVPIIMYRLYAAGIPVRLRSLLARIFRRIVVVAPDLPRAFLYTETGLVLYSTTTKLMLLSNLILYGYLSH